MAKQVDFMEPKLAYQNANANVTTLDLSLGQSALGRLVAMQPPQLDGKHNYNFDPFTLTDLQADAFWMYYLNDPTLLEEPPAERTVQHQLLKWVSDQPTWEAGRMTTTGSIFESAIASNLLTTILSSDPRIAELLKMQEELNKAMQKAAGGQPSGNPSENDGDSEGGAGEPGDSDDQGQGGQGDGEGNDGDEDPQVKQARENLQKSIENLTGEKSAYGKALRRNAVQQASDQTDQIVSAMRAWGMEPGEVSAGDVSAVLQQYKKMGDSMSEVSRLVGRMKGIATAKRMGQRQKGNTIYEVGRTRNIMNLLPGERALLSKNAPAAVRLPKIAEYCESGCLGLREEFEPADRGYFVAAVDQSGSMDGRNATMAKAISLGLAKGAEENGQNYTIFAYDTEIGPSVTSDQNWAQHIQWASAHMNGGTNFDVAIQKCISIIEALPLDEKQSADVLFITDGECAISPATVKKVELLKSEFGLRFVTLLVGNTDANYLKGISDAVVIIRNENDLFVAGDALAEAFQRMKDDD